ncbi:MAG: LysM peptidoglycan-binding domain-containing M23 family metallopeptidase [Treponema sp.]|nr:LysM peptidoglycan-binding domain-containing M23 family metallopeptidase [Treponema sp.]
MNFRAVLFGFLLGVVFFFLPPFPPLAYGQERIHTVQRGENLISIARTYGVRSEDIASLNGLSDPNRLLVGHRLRIPPAGQSGTGSLVTAAAAQERSFTTYVAQRGDTLFGIARQFSVTVGAIREANGLSENYMLRAGDTLRIPGTSAGAPLVSTPAAATVRWPVTAREVSTMTGKLSGVIITGTRAESVISLTHGVVLSAGPFQGFGRVVIVQTEGGYLYVYGGNESLSVREGDRVGPGTELGRLGIDDISNRPQLFFMVYRNNVPIDPALAPRA